LTPKNLETLPALQVQSGRLGDRFESLVRFWLENFLGVRELAQGIAIRDQRETIGELDLVYRWPGDPRAITEHWEVAVKFYMCIAPSWRESLNAEHFVGQALLDRLDKKFELSITKQLKLAEDPRAKAELMKRGFTGPLRSRLFFKGRLFYPLSWNWREVPAPEIVSAQHERGYWLAWNGSHSLAALKERAGEGCWVVLPKSRWLEFPVREPAGSAELLSDEALVLTLDQHFQRSRNALQLAWVERGGDGDWQEPPSSQGPGRGMIMMPGWPESAKTEGFQ
jgi:hypothetical protein